MTFTVCPGRVGKRDATETTYLNYFIEIPDISLLSVHDLQYHPVCVPEVGITPPRLARWRADTRCARRVSLVPGGALGLPIVVIIVVVIQRLYAGQVRLLDVKAITWKWGRGRTGGGGHRATAERPFLFLRKEREYTDITRVNIFVSNGSGWNKTMENLWNLSFCG